MAEELPRSALEGLGATFLEVTQWDWACRACIARTLELSLHEVKISLLRLGRVRGRDYIETGYGVCAGCGAQTAVVRLGRRGRLRRIA